MVLRDWIFLGIDFLGGSQSFALRQDLERIVFWRWKVVRMDHEKEVCEGKSEDCAFSAFFISVDFFLQLHHPWWRKEAR